MKRYLLFAGGDFYPLGGAWDLIGRFDSIDEAKDGFEKYRGEKDWANILDIQTCDIVLVYSGAAWDDGKEWELSKL